MRFTMVNGAEDSKVILRVIAALGPRLYVMDYDRKTNVSANTANPPVRKQSLYEHVDRNWRPTVAANRASSLFGKPHRNKLLKAMLLKLCECPSFFAQLPS
jgi:hypothetical protein